MQLSISEVSEKLGVSISTVREWERKGKLTSIRTVGGHRRYQEDDLKKLMKKDIFEIGSIVKLIFIPSWRLKIGLQNIINLSVGDIGEVVEMIKPHHDVINDILTSPFLIMVKWLECADPENRLKKSSVEPKDLVLVK
jgi:excisionase family DNA binding protein